MPKAKADSVVIHRVELQSHERESLDNFLIGKTATNAVSALGTLLTPFAGALGAIVAAWIAKEGVEAVADKVTDYFLKAGSDFVEPERQEVRNYQAIMAYIHVCNSPADFEKNIDRLWDQIGDSFLKAKVVRWTMSVKGRWAQWTWPNDALSSWKSFYPPKQALEDAKQRLKERANPTGNRGIDWLLDRIF